MDDGVVDNEGAGGGADNSVVTGPDGMVVASEVWTQ